MHGVDEVGHEDHAGVLVDQKTIAAAILDFLASERGNFLMDVLTVEDAIVKKTGFVEQRGESF